MQDLGKFFIIIILVGIGFALGVFLGCNKSMRLFNKEGFVDELEEQRKAEVAPVLTGDNKDIYVIQGTPISDVGAFSDVNTMETGAPKSERGDNSMFLYKYAECDAKCCEFGKGENASCSRGCVCKKPFFQEMVASGKGDFQFTSGNNILNDKYAGK
jgi:hypothetical protein